MWLLVLIYKWFHLHTALQCMQMFCISRSVMSKCQQFETLKFWG
uniref:Uncharacterized protein n=1 Tax=Anguilla anguilla TaxID=7936 RepID=A0A0E9QGF3_ANGAN